MNIKTIVTTVVAVIISAIILLYSPSTKALEPKPVYRVYLAGKSIGLIEDKDALEQHIDTEQENLKEQYDVSKVYAPEDLKIVQDITYDEKISTTQEMYEKIKDVEPFTIKGYAITIKGVEVMTETEEKTMTPDQTIYVLDKEVFENAMDRTIRSFVSSENYDNYLNNTQAEIKDTGTIIENIYIENKITVKEANIPVTNTIYENEEDLSKYLLYGTSDAQQTYTVQDGDTLSDIAFNNKLSNQEFLIANPNLKDENSLLYTGQQVTISIIQPQFRLVEIDHTVFLQEENYETEVRYDNTKLVGTEEVIQKGEKGLKRVTSKVQKVNGQTESSVIDTSATETIKETVKEIIVRGGRQPSYGYNITGNTTIEGYWKWPTVIPYTINSSYGYRWGTLHDGVDIGGAYGSPIYAANNGIVVDSSYKYDNGQYIIINHNNGYYTMYAHLSARYVSIGQNVSIGQEIGAMGQSGYATGTHLHFGLFQGYPYRSGSRSLQPLSLFS